MARGVLLLEEHDILVYAVIGVGLLALTAFLVLGVILAGTDGPHEWIWGAFCIGPGAIFIFSCYIRSKKITARRRLLTVIVVNGICFAVSVLLTILSALSVLTASSFTVQCALSLVTIFVQIILPWVGDIRKRLKKLGAKAWLLFDKHVLFNKEALPDADSKAQNADPQESGSRPLGAAQASDGPDRPVSNSIEELARGYGEATEMTDIV